MSPVPPPAVAERSARLAAQSPSAWSGGAADLAALGRVGFDFVGEVMGAVAAQLTTDQTGLCGYRSGRASVRLGGELRGARNVSYPRRASAAYATALSRLRDEAGQRNADGVVAVRLDVQHREGDLAEIVLRGLAVRARAAVRPDRPFLTQCDPLQVASLLTAGWIPVDVHVAVQLGVRHDDDDVEHVDQLRAGRSRRRSNFPVPGYTELAAAVRASVRDSLAEQARSAGADGALVGDITTAARHAPCAQLLNRTDRVVRATGVASSLARFDDRVTVPPPLMTIDLATRSTGKVRPR